MNGIEQEPNQPSSHEAQVAANGAWVAYNKVTHAITGYHGCIDEDVLAAAYPGCAELVGSLKGHDLKWEVTRMYGAIDTLVYRDVFIFYADDEEGHATTPKVIIYDNNEKFPWEPIVAFDAPGKPEESLLDAIIEKAAAMQAGEAVAKIAKDIKRLMKLPADLSEDDRSFLASVYQQEKHFTGFDDDEDQPDETSKITELLLARNFVEDMESIYQTKDHDVIVQELIKSRFDGEQSWQAASDIVKAFSNLSRETAQYIMDQGRTDIVAGLRSHFDEKIDNAEFARQLIDAPKIRCENELFSNGGGFSVAKNLAEFEGVDHREIALRIIRADQGSGLVNNLDNFEGLDHHEMAIELIRNQQGYTLAHHFEKFEGLDPKEMAEELLMTGQGADMLGELKKNGVFAGCFEDINEPIVRTIQSGGAVDMLGYIQDGVWLEGVDLAAIARELIMTAQDYPAQWKHLNGPFMELEQEIAKQRKLGVVSRDEMHARRIAAAVLDLSKQPEQTP